MTQSSKGGASKETDERASKRINDDFTTKSTDSNSSDLDSPRSILRSNKNLFRYSNFVSRGRIRRNVSFSRRNQVFLIPNRKMLREEQRKAIRRRQLKRRLVLRRNGYNIVYRRRRQASGRRAIDGQIRRPNRLARARRRFFRTKRRLQENSNRIGERHEAMDEVMDSHPREQDTSRRSSNEGRAVRRRRSEMRRKHKTRSKSSQNEDDMP